MGRVIRIQDKAPEAALERLQRLTGLDFASWPESLLSEPVRSSEAQPEASATGLAPGGEYVAAAVAEAKR